MNYQEILDNIGPADPVTGCRLWMRARQWRKGYGRARFEGKDASITRILLSKQLGPIPDGLCVCHRCDNPPCCNVEHLFLGTQGDNNRDRQAKGRSVNARGESSHTAKLTESQVREIVERLSFASKRGANGMLALEFGVSRTAIRFIASGTNWAHVAPVKSLGARGVPELTR